MGESTVPGKSTPRVAGATATSVRAQASQKAAATVLRHKAEARAESLQHIRAQTADGSLTVRHMSADEFTVATELARVTREHNETRVKKYQSPGESRD